MKKNMRMHFKNVLAGVGTGVVLATFVIIGISSFANVVDTIPAQVTIVNDVIPDSDPSTSPHSDIDFGFVLTSSEGGGSAITLDDDGDSKNTHSNTITYHFSIKSEGQKFNIKETPNKDTYLVSYACFRDDDPNRTIFLKNNSNETTDFVLSADLGTAVTCTFTNNIGAELIIKKNVTDEEKGDIESNEIFSFSNENDRTGFELDDNNNDNDGRKSEKHIVVKKDTEYKFYESLTPEQEQNYKVAFSCDDKDNTHKDFNDPDSNVLVLPGLNGDRVTTCVFVNKKVYTKITIKKDVVDPVGNSGAQSLNGEYFEIINPFGDPVKLDDDKTDPPIGSNYFSETTFDAKPGIEYSFQENLNDLQKAIYDVYYDCGGNPVSGNSFKITFKPGEKAICTFVNKQKAYPSTVVFKKIAIPSTGDIFRFDVILKGTNGEYKIEKTADVPGDGSVPDGVKLLIPGNQKYIFREIIQTNTRKYEIKYSCESKKSGQYSEEKNFTEPIYLYEKDKIVCTFTNTEAGSHLIIKKQTDSTSSFNFDIFKYVKGTNLGQLEQKKFGTATLYNDGSKSFDSGNDEAYKVLEAGVDEKIFNISFECKYTPISSNYQSGRYPNTTGSGAIINAVFVHQGYDTTCTFINKCKSPVLCPRRKKTTVPVQDGVGDPGGAETQ